MPIPAIKQTLHRLYQVFYRLPLSLKALLIGAIAAGAVGIALQSIQPRQLEALLNKELQQRLEIELVAIRTRFHDYLLQNIEFADRLATNLRFLNHIKNEHHGLSSRQPQPSVKNPGPPVEKYRGIPQSWQLPKNFWLQGFRPDYILVFNTEMQAEETITLTQDSIPEYLINISPVLLDLSDQDAYLTMLDGQAYSLVSQYFANNQYRLLVATQIDDQFLIQSQQSALLKDRIVALMEGQKKHIIASTDSYRLAHSDLTHDFITGGNDFFDYGASDLELQLALLIPKYVYDALNKDIIKLDSTNRIIALTISLAVFVLLIQLHALRLSRFLAKIRQLASQTLGSKQAEHTAETRDELVLLEQVFNQFAEQLVSTKELEQWQQERDKESLQLSMLESITINLGIGLLLRHNQDLKVLNSVMKEHFSLCPSLWKFCLEETPNEEQTFTDIDGNKRIFTFTDVRLGDQRQAILVQDVTVERTHTETLEKIARHDSLTGLINRYAFEKHFEELVSHQDEMDKGQQHILVYLDLDQFKVVNDTCGHAAGDILLQKLSLLCKQHIRQSDVLARLGGDEFGLILPFCTESRGKAIVQEIINNIISFRFHWDEKIFRVGISAGMAAFDNAKEDIGEILSIVDSCCYIAKESGGNQLHFYHPGDQDILLHTQQLDWTSRLNKALDLENKAEQFTLYIQPIASLGKSLQAEHYEILIRFQDDDGKIIPPGAFLPCAERYNLIENIDRHVVSQVIEWLQAHQKNNPNIVFSINLSGKSLGSLDFQDFLVDLLKNADIDIHALCFEITETAIVNDVMRSIEFINAVKSLGASFSLDDFGSGLSSFSYLKQFPVDFLKIDGEFVKNIMTNSEDYVFVRSITEIGHCLGMKVIAEFVESTKTYHILREAQVDMVQGWAVGKPRPLDSLNV